MKITNTLKVFSVVALAVILFCLVLAAGNSINDKFLSSLAEHIPLLKTFVVKDYQTNLFGMTTEDSGVLKIARYDIDFLASYTGKGGRYIALYPAVVEAEINIENAKKDGKTGVISLKRPVYRAKLDQDNANALVFMDSLSLDYNKMVAPVLKMYQARACDFALADTAFGDECLRRAEDYVGTLFGKGAVKWTGTTVASETDGDCVPMNVRSANLPVGLDCSAPSGKLIFSKPQSLRDDFIVSSSLFGGTGAASFRFGLAGKKLQTFDAFVQSTEAQYRDSHIVFRYHDPVYGNDRTFVSFADEGFRTSFIYLKGEPNYYYLDTVSLSQVNDELFQQNISPNALYLSACVYPAQASAAKANSALAGQYASYFAEYAAALDAVRNGRYGKQLADSLDALDRISAEVSGNVSSDAQIIRELSDLKSKGYKKGSLPITGKNVSLLAMLLDPSSGAVGTGSASDASVSSDSSSAGLALASDGDEVSGNLAAFFWMKRVEFGISDLDAQGYKADLIGNGSAINRELVASLTDEERNALYLNFFLKHLPANVEHTVYKDENVPAQTWLFYGAAANKRRAETTQKKIADKLGRMGMTGGNRFVFVFSDPMDKTGLFTQYHAFSLDGKTVTVFNDFASWIQLGGEPKPVSYPDIVFVDKSFSIGKRMYSGHEDIESVLKIFSEAFSSDFYNRDKIIEIITSDIEKEVIAKLERPVL